MVNLRQENRNNQTYESQEISLESCYHGGMNNKLVKIEVWTSLLKQEAGGDDCLEMSNRCVIHKMGVNQEATAHSLEIEKQGKDWQETEVRELLPVFL